MDAGTLAKFLSVDLALAVALVIIFGVAGWLSLKIAVGKVLAIVHRMEISSQNYATKEDVQDIRRDQEQIKERLAKVEARVELK